MLQKNVAGQGVYLYAVDTTQNPPVGKVGDGATITGHYSIDGGAPTGFNTPHPTEIGGGVYWQPLAIGETNGNLLACYWSDSTTGIVIDPVFETTWAPNMNALGITAAGKLSEVVLVDTLTTYTNDTPQSGDNFARIGPNGANLTALASHTDATTIESAVGSPAQASALAAVASALSALASAVGTPMQAGSSVSLNLSEVLSAPRVLDSVPDNQLTINDGLHCAIAVAAGKIDNTAGTEEIVKTPAGTVLRNFAIQLSAGQPVARS